MPIFLISGFDAITCIAAIYMGSSIGTMFSTVNPFSVVIASNAAEIAKLSIKTGTPVAQIVLERGLLTKDELDIILNPFEMTKPGIPGKELLKK